MSTPTKPWSPHWHIPTKSNNVLVDPYGIPLPLEQRSPQTWPGSNRGNAAWNKGQRVPATVLTADEVQAMIEATRENYFGAKNRAIIALLYGTGVRVNEMRHVRAWDIDAPHYAVRVVYGRNQRTRTVGIDPIGLGHVIAWIDIWKAQGFAADAPLFCTRSGRVMSKSEVTRMLKTVARRAGIEKRVHSHAFRHSLAYQMALDGVPWIIIRYQLGHVWSTSTERYLSHLAPELVFETMRQRTWGGDTGHKGTGSRVDPDVAINVGDYPSTGRNLSEGVVGWEYVHSGENIDLHGGQEATEGLAPHTVSNIAS